MKPRQVLALLAGLSLSAAATGASSALIAMPAALVIASGVSCAALALAHPRYRRSAALLLGCGALIGTTLPHSAPPISGAVVTHVVGPSMRGDIFELLGQIDADPRALLGRYVIVSGDWSPVTRNGAATVSRRVMTCCAADAVRVGFDVATARPIRLPDGTTVRASGFLRSRMRDGDVRYVIDDAMVLRCDMQRCVSP